MTSALATPPDTSQITIHRASGTLVVRPAPRREPPFDDEVSAAPAPGRHDRPLPFLTARPPAPRSLPTGAAAAGPPGRQATPDPAVWGRRLLVGIIECAAGRRPLNQLTTLLSPGVAHGLRTDFEREAALGRPHWTHTARVRSVHSSAPAADVAELATTVRTGSRVRAIAMRLEVRHGRWCCTRLVLG